MERIGIPECRNRVSPVIDVAALMRIADIEDGEIVNQQTLEMEWEGIHLRIKAIVEAKIDVVICGAISDRMVRRLMNENVGVICWISGDVEEVIARYVSGRSFPDNLIMPGCQRCRRRWRQHPGKRKERNSR